MKKSGDICIFSSPTDKKNYIVVLIEPANRNFVQNGHGWWVYKRDSMTMTGIGAVHNKFLRILR